MTASKEAKYDTFTITSADGKRTADFNNGDFKIIGFDYFENILSPYITGSATLVSTNNSVSSEEDRQERLSSLYTGLPLRAGCVVKIKVTPELGDPLKLDLHVTHVEQASKSSSEVLHIKLASKIAILNETTKIERSFRLGISDIARKIIREDLKIRRNKIVIDKTSNPTTYVVGMRKRPFDLLLMLAQQSVPKKTSNPGYFCYETKNGFHFVSADTLINQDPYPYSYHYAGGNQSTAENKDDSNNYKVSDLKVKKDQHFLDQIRFGMYSTKNIFFNPSTNGFTEITISADVDGKFPSLGKRKDTPKIIKDEYALGKKYHRIQTAILDAGSSEESKSINNSPEMYYAAATARYNILFAQETNITVPCNTLLDAGTAIDLQIESISDQKEQGPDPVQSGKYIISSLRHHFDSDRSLTSMKLIRAGYGLHFTTEE
ncbi:MAG: hypothetical protein CMG75_10715 [Candidatus Marinimicrobia bacterium]|nr:hypothetical protein [Candidatus Neomarinimicrobiota bacterium]|tara:strand:- start:3425 stop:4723 length:1299 start_codon:yes stop_codon:yes gene_type:complete